MWERLLTRLPAGITVQNAESLLQVTQRLRTGMHAKKQVVELE